MKYLSIILISILPYVSAGMNYAIGDTLNVVAINGLSVRAQPNLKGEKLLVLNTKDKVIVIDTLDGNSNTETIFGFSGRWVLIKTPNDVNGYVFDSFLSTLPYVTVMTSHKTKSSTYEHVYSDGLPELLNQYVDQYYTKNDCDIEYFNRVDGETALRMHIQKFKEGHTLIKHQYWEGNSTELRLVNVRLSEIFYLVHQFMENDKDGIITIDDYKLRNPKAYKDWKSCVGKIRGESCGIEIYKDSENSYTLKFNFPCC